jgi:hypothetical protein
VEIQLEEHLSRLCLGTPLLNQLTVAQTKKEIMLNQGCFIEGPLEPCLEKIKEDCLNMRKTIEGKLKSAREIENLANHSEHNKKSGRKLIGMKSMNSSTTLLKVKSSASIHSFRDVYGSLNSVFEAENSLLDSSV